MAIISTTTIAKRPRNYVFLRCSTRYTALILLWILSSCGIRKDEDGHQIVEMYGKGGVEVLAVFTIDFQAVNIQSKKAPQWYALGYRPAFTNDYFLELANDPDGRLVGKNQDDPDNPNGFHNSTVVLNEAQSKMSVRIEHVTEKTCVRLVEIGKMEYTSVWKSLLVGRDAKQHQLIEISFP